MEDVRLSFLSGAQGPGLAVIQECAHNACPIDLYLGVVRQLTVGPYSPGQFGHGGSCVADALKKLCRMKGSLRSSNPRTQVVNNLQFLVRDSDVGWGYQTLIHDLCFLLTDGEPEIMADLPKVTHKLIKFMS